MSPRPTLTSAEIVGGFAFLTNVVGKGIGQINGLATKQLSAEAQLPSALGPWPDDWVAHSTDHGSPMGGTLCSPRDTRGFTLVELLIGMFISVVVVGAIGSALVVSFRTTDVTQERMSESHDAQVSSAYLANDVQGANKVTVGAGGDCSGASTKIVTFDLAKAPAVYSCGTVAGETRVVRTFDGNSQVLAHFAGSSESDPPVGPPEVKCAPNADCTGTVAVVWVTFHEASGFNYTLVGSRRDNGDAGPPSGVGSPADVTLLATGSTGGSSPLWVQGTCQTSDPGTTPDCAYDSSLTAVPTADVATSAAIRSAWTPSIPSTLWDKLADQDDTTSIATTMPNKEVQFDLSPVTPPIPGTNPVVELRGQRISPGNAQVTIALYDGTQQFATKTVTLNGNSVGNSDWTLAPTDTAKIPPASYAHLRIGVSLTGGTGANIIGAALDTGTMSGTGVLTVNGPLYVNSQSSNAVRITGSKAPKITINSGDFQIWSPGQCAGCSHTTVSCAACNWSGQKPWTPYQQPIPDPLRALPAPDESLLGSGGCTGTVCQPGVYEDPLSRTGQTQFSPGIYYLKKGISLTGNGAITCPSPCNGGLLFYIGGKTSGATFAGTSNINLPARTSGVYKDILVFQARDNSEEFKVTGNGGNGVADVFGGVIYVPRSKQVTLATGNAKFSAKAIVAQNIKVSSNVTVG